jgi:hypothetical protein
MINEEMIASISKTVKRDNTKIVIGKEDFDTPKKNSTRKEGKAMNSKVIRDVAQRFAPRLFVALSLMMLVLVGMQEQARADFNSDATVDIMFAGGDEVCFGDGVGGFTCSNVVTRPGSSSSDVALGDMNGDGNLDAVFAKSGNDDYNDICLGDCEGNFDCSDFGPGSQARDVALGDVNGDGNLDAVFANWSGVFNQVCLGDGLGGSTCSDFGPESRISRGVALGHVNGDGNLDAYFANSGNDCDWICLGNGSGGFTCSDVPAMCDASGAVALGDVNGDGNLDAVVSGLCYFTAPLQPCDKNRVCLGNGSGGFTCSDVSSDQNDTGGVALGDVNGDGNLDALFANDAIPHHPSADQFFNQVCLGDGSGGFTCNDLSQDERNTEDVALGDVDDDGDLDAILVNDDSDPLADDHPEVCLNDGSGGFTCSDIVPSGVSFLGVAISSGVWDTTPPVITCPSDVSLECDEPTDPSNTGTATATDCDTNPTIEYSDAITPGSCPQEETITRTWTATDAYGNSSSCIQTINVVDNTPPVIECNAPDYIFPWEAPISFTASATDNCDVVDPSAGITGFDCFDFTKKEKRIDKKESCIVQVSGNTITIIDGGGIGDNITWTVSSTDGCGNVAVQECMLEVFHPKDQ